MSLQGETLGVSVEILDLIFFHCLKDTRLFFNPRPDRLHKDISTKIALRLSHVCQYWRQVVSANPRLWTHLSTDWRTELIQLYLERSRDISLAIFINAQNTLCFPYGSWNILNGCTHRWEYLECYFLSPDDRNFAQSLNPTPRLLQFQISGSRRISHSIQSWLADIMRQSPRLQHTVWQTSISPAWFVTQVATKPWKQLKGVTFGFLSVMEAVDVLTNFGENVTDVRIGIRFTHYPGISWSDVSIQNLQQQLSKKPRHTLVRNLTITECDAGNIPPILLFNHLFAPHLHSFALHYTTTYFTTSPYYPWPRHALMEMFARSQCRLRNLKLVLEYRMSYAPDVTLEDIESAEERDRQEEKTCLVEMLSHPSLATLKTLTIATNMSIVTEEAIEYLTLPPLPQDVLDRLPNLQRFAFAFILPTSKRLVFSPGKLQRMAQSRLDHARSELQTASKRTVKDLTVVLPILGPEPDSDPSEGDWHALNELEQEYQDVGFFWHLPSELPHHFRV